MQAETTTLKEQLALLSEQKCSLDHRLAMMAERQSFTEHELDAERQRCVELSTQRDATKSELNELAQARVELERQQDRQLQDAQILQENAAITVSELCDARAELTRLKQTQELLESELRHETSKNSVVFEEYAAAETHAMEFAAALSNSEESRQ